MGKGPYLPNLEPFFAAGIDPKTGLPIKVSSADEKHLKENVKMFLRLVDEQDAVNRYVWYNLPCNITSQELERMLYYRGQLAFFYSKDDEKFYFMPYTLDGTIDYFGRYNTIHPIPFVEGKEGSKSYRELKNALSSIKLNCVYGMKLDAITEDDVYKSAVLLHDYTKQLSQNIVPRVTVNDPILDAMAECVPLARTARILSTGIKAIRVNDEDQAINVEDANRSLETAAMQGRGFVPIVGAVEFQEMTNGQIGKGEEYMLAMQSLDNLRLSGYGIDNGGLFNKKSQYVNEAQTMVAGGPIGLVMQDGLSIRQNFCNIVNSIWGIGIWCEPAQNVSGADLDQDGLLYDETTEDKAGVVESAEEGDEE